MNAQPVTAKPSGSKSSRTAKKNTPQASAPAAVVQPPPAPSEIKPDNSVERGERTETGSGDSKTWEHSEMQAQKAHQEVVFTLEIHHAKEVLLVGDFTDWQKNPIRLRQGGGETWHAKVILPPGRHLYRYLVDGQWHDNPTQLERVPNAFGTTDHVIEIS
jgi:hypothetical protein